MEWTDPPADLTRHVVICNCNEKTGRIVDRIHDARVQPPMDVVLLVQDLAVWEANPSWHPRGDGSGRVYSMIGCPTSEDDLRQASIHTARAAVILADPAHGALADARSTLVAMAIERENPQVHTVMELFSSVSRVHLQSTDVNEVICVGEISEKLIAQSCISPGIKNIFLHLLTTGHGTNQVFISPLPDSARGMVYRDLARQVITSGAPFVLCGYIRLGPDQEMEAHRLFVINPRAGEDPGKDTALEEGDQLVLLAHEPPDLDRYLPHES